MLKRDVDYHLVRLRAKDRDKVVRGRWATSHTSTYLVKLLAQKDRSWLTEFLNDYTYREYGPYWVVVPGPKPQKVPPEWGEVCP